MHTYINSSNGKVKAKLIANAQLVLMEPLHGKNVLVRFEKETMINGIYKMDYV